MPDAQHRTADEVLSGIREQVRAASDSRTPLSIEGGGTKRHLRPAPGGEVLSLADFAGVIDYIPSELVIVARAGTLLTDIESELAAHGQHLAFEPPRTGANSTLGGVISAGLSGPARPYTAATRDHVLGVTLVDSRGELLRFGGKVMKNVAGYDISRLVVGAWGSLGPVLEVALRVVPMPAAQRCFCWPLAPQAALGWMQEAGRNAAWPFSGLCFESGQLHVRLAGSRAAVDQAALALPAGATEEAHDFWSGLRDFQLPFFEILQPLWRIVLPPAAAPLSLPGESLWDWGGAQRWLKTSATPEAIMAAANRAGGYARCVGPSFAARDASLPGPRRELEARIRHGFDPCQLFNPELETGAA